MYDYIIVGAGSAGCVLAHRLSEDPACRVLLLEAGPRDWHPFIHMPAGLAKLVGQKGVNWNYDTAPEPHLENRRLWWPRGKVLGGSSSINAMCYIRGVPQDYDDWADAGAEGWDWNSVLPYFRRSERNSRGADALHGADGPLHVSDLRYTNELSAAFIEAGVQAGYGRNPDFNGRTQEGFGLYQVTQKDGARCSSAVAYLDPARDRQNLDIVTGALVRRILLDKNRAIGVAYARGGHEVVVRCEGEVLLSGGAINSPQLLMLSGIGPAEHLASHGITPRHVLPGVGRNLQDHLDICTLQHSTQRVPTTAPASSRPPSTTSCAGIAARAAATSPRRARSCVRRWRRTTARTSRCISYPRCWTITAATAFPATATRRMPASCARAAAAASCWPVRTRARTRASRRTTSAIPTAST